MATMLPPPLPGHACDPDQNEDTSGDGNYDDDDDVGHKSHFPV